MANKISRKQQSNDLAKERHARQLSADTLIDVRTVRRWLDGHPVQRSTALALEAADTRPIQEG